MFLFFKRCFLKIWIMFLGIKIFSGKEGDLEEFSKLYKCLKVNGLGVKNVNVLLVF